MRPLCTWSWWICLPTRWLRIQPIQQKFMKEIETVSQRWNCLVACWSTNKFYYVSHMNEMNRGLNNSPCFFPSPENSVQIPVCVSSTFLEKAIALDNSKLISGNHKILSLNQKISKITHKTHFECFRNHYAVEIILLVHHLPRKCEGKEQSLYQDIYAINHMPFSWNL